MGQSNAIKCFHMMSFRHSFSSVKRMHFTLFALYIILSLLLIECYGQDSKRRKLNPKIPSNSDLLSLPPHIFQTIILPKLGNADAARLNTVHSQFKGNTREILLMIQNKRKQDLISMIPLYHHIDIFMEPLMKRFADQEQDQIYRQFHTNEEIAVSILHHANQPVFKQFLKYATFQCTANRNQKMCEIINGHFEKILPNGNYTGQISKGNPNGYGVFQNIQQDPNHGQIVNVVAGIFLDHEYNLHRIIQQDSYCWKSNVVY